MNVLIAIKSKKEDEKKNFDKQNFNENIQNSIEINQKQMSNEFMNKNNIPLAKEKILKTFGFMNLLKNKLGNKKKITQMLDPKLIINENNSENEDLLYFLFFFIIL